MFPGSTGTYDSVQKYTSFCPSSPLEKSTYFPATQETSIISLDQVSFFTASAKLFNGIMLSADCKAFPTFSVNLPPALVLIP